MKSTSANNVYLVENADASGLIFKDQMNLVLKKFITISEDTNQFHFAIQRPGEEIKNTIND